MSIEDIDYLKKNSTKENYLFLVDSKMRDYVNFPDPNNYTITFNIPFKNVIGIEVIDASIPRTMYTIDKYNNTIYYYIANSLSEYNGVINNGSGLSRTVNMSIFKKLEIPPGNYTIQTFIPTFNSLMKQGSQTPGITNIYSPISIVNYSNPPELSNRIIFTCKNPFIIDMNRSTIAETLGCSLNIDSNNDGILYKYFNNYQGNLQFLKMYHSILNPVSGLYEITSPGIIFFIGEKYIVIRSPEIEEHAFGSMAYNNHNQGIAKFKVSGIGFNEEKVELTKIPTREFHPIGKLSKITFRFETADGNLYDFKGVNHTVTYLIKYYKPKMINIQEFKPLLNPNYKSDFNEYRYLNDDQQLSDEEDKNEFSRDNLFERYKYNELSIKKEIDDEDAPEEDDDEET
jgi:hypothetical protein